MLLVRPTTGGNNNHARRAREGSRGVTDRQITRANPLGQEPGEKTAMVDHANSIRILQEILAAQEHLALLLGPDWPAFRAEVLASLEALSADTGLTGQIDQIVERGLNSPATSLFRAILQRSQPRSGIRKGSAVSDSLPSVGTVEELRQTAVELKRSLTEAPTPDARYLNAGFFPEPFSAGHVPEMDQVLVKRARQ
jgi:hypothetical protein